MAKRVLLVHFAGDPEGLSTRIEVSTIRYAFRWRAVERKHIVAPGIARTALTAAERAHVLVSLADGRIAVTEYGTIRRLLTDIDDSEFVHANHSVYVNMRRIEKVRLREGWLVYYPRGMHHAEEREAIMLSRTAKRLVRDALSGPGAAADDPAPPAADGPRGAGRRRGGAKKRRPKSLRRRGADVVDLGPREPSRETPSSHADAPPSLPIDTQRLERDGGLPAVEADAAAASDDREADHDPADDDGAA